MGRPTTVALALGSGGARGYAHIGAIQVLTERNIKIVAVAGSSMGAMVGGMYAAGKLGEYTDWVCGLSELDLVRLLDVKVGEPGLIGAEKVFAHIRGMLGDAQIEKLSTSFTAVATDLHARRAVWLQQGSLEKAIRASIAMPGVFTPVKMDGRLLVDGGLMDPVPVAPTASAAADVTIAIDLNGELRKHPDGTPAGDTTEDGPFEELIDRFRRRASHVLQREMVRALFDHHGGAGGDSPSLADDHLDAVPTERGLFDVMNLSLEAMQAVLTGYRLAGNPPDILVSVPRDACHSRSFHRASKLIGIGHRLTEDALDRSGIPGLAR